MCLYVAGCSDVVTDNGSEIKAMHSMQCLCVRAVMLKKVGTYYVQWR